MKGWRFLLLIVPGVIAAAASHAPAGESRKPDRPGAAMADPEALDARGQSIVFKRVMEEDIAAITALLDAGLAVDVRGSFDATPALRAAVADVWPVVQLLLDRGADPMVADRRGLTIPWLAATSRIGGTGPRARALCAVRAQLAEGGYFDNIHSPAEVMALQSGGALAACAAMTGVRRAAAALALWQGVVSVAPAQQVDITAKGPDGLPGIFWLIKQEDMTGIAAWLDAGGNIEARGYHGASRRGRRR